MSQMLIYDLNPIQKRNARNIIAMRDSVGNRKYLLTKWRQDRIFGFGAIDSS